MRPATVSEHLPAPGAQVASRGRSYGRTVNGVRQERAWWRGTVLARNDVRAWRGRAAVGFSDEPSQADVDALVARQDWAGSTRVPVEWDSGGFAWVDWDQASSLIPWDERDSRASH